MTARRVDSGAADADGGRRADSDRRARRGGSRVSRDAAPTARAPAPLPAEFADALEAFATHLADELGRSPHTVRA